MADFVVDHALANVWCVPAQDRQFTIRLARLSANGGKRNRIRVHWEEILLPNEGNNEYWHVYQIGQLPPSIINVFTTRPVINGAQTITGNINPSEVGVSAAIGTVYSQINNFNVEIARWFKYGDNDLDWSKAADGNMIRDRWRKLSGICELNNLHIDLVTSSGLQIPKSLTYIRYTRDGNLLLATRVIYGFGDIEGSGALDNSDAYARFYSNAYYDSTAWTDDTVSPDNPIQIEGQLINTNSDFYSIRQRWMGIKNLFGSLGSGMWFLNGIAIGEPANLNAYPVMGKYLEFVWDASIRQQYVVDVSDLTSFNSTLDSGAAKLIVLTGTTYNTIDYIDDVDFYLAHTETSNRYHGVILSKLDVENIRMLTHNAYSVLNNHLTSLVAQHGFLNNLMECKLIVNIRNSGMIRGLVHQHNRIEELYRMDRDDILGAFSGVNATLPEWTADALESSAYVEIMGKAEADIDNLLVEEAYGYNAFTKAFMEPYSFAEIQPGQRYANIPIGLCVAHPTYNVARRSVFTYDQDGKFLYGQTASGTYNQVPVNALNGVEPYLVETLHAVIDDTDGTKFPYYHSGTNTFTETVITNEGLRFHGFRVYTCPIVAGVPTEVWQDITGNTTYYTYSEAGPIPTLTWNTANLIASQLFPCVKMAKDILFYKVPFDQNAYPGYIHFSVNSNVRWMGVNGKRIQSVPVGTIDIFMDGECLTEGIDYYVTWPAITIVRKPKRTTLDGLEVYVRCQGFCDPNTMQHYAPREVGFVKGGILSVDGQFDIRNDRPIRILAGGMLKHRSQVRFAEDVTGPVITDGLPFSVSDVLVPVEHLSSKTTVEYRQDSLDLDNDVQNYLDLRITENTPSNPAIVDERWVVVSPFFGAVLYSVIQGLPSQAQLEAGYNNLDVAGWVSQFTYLLPHDPCTLSVDEDYIQINPHQFDYGFRWGGALAIVSGLTFSIGAGGGFVLVGHTHIEVTWSAQNAVATYGGPNYVAVNQSGSVVISNAIPNPQTHVLLGKVIASYDGLTFAPIALTGTDVELNTVYVTAEQYAYLEYVVQHYLNGALDITQFITIGS